MRKSSCINPDYSYPDSKEFPKVLASRYRIEKPLGTGGFARTFLAVDELCLEKPCVIKQFLPPQLSPETYEKAVKLFKQEATILRSLGHHPKIPSLLAFIEEEEGLYLVQELFEGQDLFKEVTQSGPFNERQIHKLLTDLLPVLQFAHEQHVIHRDIKPSNIIRQPNGSLVLIDFGSSLQLGRQVHSNTGTLGYAAPEQLQGKVCHASDLYSLGITCIRLLTGLVPNKGSSDPLFTSPQSKWNWRQLGLTIGPTLSQIFDKLLQTEVNKRFQSASEVIQLLEDHSFQDTVSAEQKDVPKPLRKKQTSTVVANVGGADYRKLHGLLAAHKFQEADLETWRVMLEISNRKAHQGLSIFSLRQFPIEDLLAIDRLWGLLSNGRFGFSVQNQIFKRAGGSEIFDYHIWQEFGQTVGWCDGENWRSYLQLTFNIDAPKGHFPAYFVNLENQQDKSSGGVFNWWRFGFVSLIHRLDEGSKGGQGHRI